MTKYTSYETSLRLQELGFECDTHTGWWGVTFDLEKGLVGTEPFFAYVFNANQLALYKAFDCFDLLMWLQKELGDLPVADLAFDKTSFYYLSNRKEDTTSDPSPTEALAQAIIKILQGETK